MIAPAPFSALTREEEALLLRLAWRAVRAAVEGRDVPGQAEDHPLLRAPRDAFVTLRRGAALRGCVGTWQAARPLHENLLRAARGAAIDDPRFPPVEQPELDGLRIEVTLLDPPFPIASPETIEVGRHGLSVTLGRARGLLLPQVALEHGLDAEAFLGLACRKAGLPPDAWRGAARVEVFTAQSVSDDVGAREA